MNGTVDNVQFAYAFVRGTDRLNYFVPAEQMPMDELGRRYLMPGEEVTFTPSTGDGRSGQARDIRLVTQRPPVVGYYEEEGMVKHVAPSGEYCFVERPFGGVAMLHHRQVCGCNPHDEDDKTTFVRGQRWAFEIRRPKDITRPWLAVHARQLQP